MIGAVAESPRLRAGPRRELPEDVILSVRDLRTHFFLPDGVSRAVDGVSFDVRRGEMLAIVGESGSGKSVTSLSIMRLLDRTPGRIVGGSILLRDEADRVHDVAAADRADLRRLRGKTMSMIFQDPMSSLNPVFTIGDQIAETIELHQAIGRAAAWRKAGELLRLVGIADPERRLRAYPHQLSGGMRQRVMIAIALSCEPTLLIADEPTTALDVTIQAQIIDLINTLRRDRRMGVLFITHDLGLVADVADRIAVMYGGQVVEEGRAGEVLARPRHPYTRALLDCIPRHRTAAEARAYGPIPGAPPNPLRPPHGCRFAPRCPLVTDRCTAAPVPLFDTGEGRHTSRCVRWEDVR